MRIRAPELRGRGGWIGAVGPAPTLAGLRGKVVLLDFWTFCCVNCLHVLEQLRPLEQRFADVLVVLGVHSPKFPHEGEHAAVVAAVDRYEVDHPVLDDPDLQSWQQYAVRAWPTLVLIDPEGYVVHVASGEGHADDLARLIGQLVIEHEAKGTLRRAAIAPYVAPAPTPGELAFPGKAVRLPDGLLLVSDSRHHRLVVLDGDRVARRIGTGERGWRDGAQPQFAEPQGLCLLADGRVLVADTANHCLRRVDLSGGAVTTVAGTGEQLRPGDPVGGLARSSRLSSPWDVAVYDGQVVIAMAGTHQLWALADDELRVLAGTGGEGLRDGPADGAYLAQPSGLAAGADRLWFADAETSSLRWYADGQVGTAVGSGLFDFGHRDGAADEALLQHPLGVTVLPDGSVAISDTYNGAIRRYDPRTGLVTTLLSGLAEPSDAVVDGGYLLVVESAAHRISRLPLPAEVTPHPPGPVTDLGLGTVTIEVVFEPPPGQHLDERDGPAVRLTVGASPAGLLTVGAGPSYGLVRELVLAPGEGVLHVAATAASCDDAGEHPACHLTRQDWGLPVRVVAGGPDRLCLVLRRLDR